MKFPQALYAHSCNICTNSHYKEVNEDDVDVESSLRFNDAKTKRIQHLWNDEDVKVDTKHDKRDYSVKDT